MTQKIFFYIGIATIIAILSFGFENNKYKNKDSFFPFKEDNSKVVIPYTGTHFVGYKEAIGIKESGGNYQLVNSLGYLGKYQFGETTLKNIVVVNKSEFLNNRNLQEKTFIAHLSMNKFILKDIIEKHEGTVINGIKITESGILAAAHLAGANSVKDFFNSNGKKDFKDAYGTSLQNYLKLFGGYDTSSIIASKKPFPS